MAGGVPATCGGQGVLMFIPDPARLPAPEIKYFAGVGVLLHFVAPERVEIHENHRNGHFFASNGTKTDERLFAFQLGAQGFTMHDSYVEVVSTSARLCPLPTLEIPNLTPALVAAFPRA